jgi:hypothetical protein
LFPQPELNIVIVCCKNHHQHQPSMLPTQLYHPPPSPNTPCGLWPIAYQQSTDRKFGCSSCWQWLMTRRRG